MCFYFYYIYPIPCISITWGILDGELNTFHYNEHNEHNELYEKNSFWFLCVSYYIGNESNQTNNIMRCGSWLQPITTWFNGLMW
jgi:hypothetical protein